MKHFFVLLFSVLSIVLLFDQYELSAENPYAQLARGTWVHQSTPVVKNGLPFWLYSNNKMRRGKRYPLVVALHGRRNKVAPGAEFKVQAIATAWSKDAVQKSNPCFVFQPYYPPKGGWEKIPEALDASIEDLVKRLPIDPARIYLFGFSNGGQGTFQTLARHPNRFAAAVTVSGPVPIDSVVGKIQTPLWCWVGENDHDMDKVGRVKKLAHALQDAGASVKLNVVPNAGHACHAKATGNPKVHEWLFSQVLSSPDRE
jgi:predicted peptidase